MSVGEEKEGGRKKHSLTFSRQSSKSRMCGTDVVACPRWLLH